MRVVFMGNIADYSPPFLHALVERSNRPDDPVSVAAVVCPTGEAGTARAAAFRAKRLAGEAIDRLEGRAPGLSERLAGRGSGVHRTMQRLAHHCDAPIVWPTDLESPEFLAQVSALDADLTLVAGLDRILRPSTLDALPTAYNVHPSMLPEFRGAFPEFWQLDGGADSGGVTIHRIDPGIDTGPIALQRRFGIEPWFDATDLIARAVEVGVELVDELLDGGDLGVDAREQGAGSYQPIPGAGERSVPVDRSASGVFDRARAWGFSIPLWLDVPGDAWSGSGRIDAGASSGPSTRLQLFDPVVHTTVAARPRGSVVRTSRGSVVVWCADGAVEFRRVESGDPVDADSPATGR